MERIGRLFDAVNLRRQRRRTVEPAAGRVLEVGVGSGPNLGLYERAESVVGIDVDADALRRARPRAAAARVPVELIEADAQALPFEDASFDTVVIGLALCTIPDPDAALREVRRVLRPDGRLRFLEHVRARTPWAARLQDRLERPWMRIAGGCHPNRDTVAAIEREFEVERIRRRGVLVQGEARPRA